MLNGEEVARGDEFGNSWSYDVTNCNGFVTQPPSASPVTQSPSASPVKQCEDGSNLVTIEITLGEQPRDSYWYLTDADAGSDNDIIFDGPYQFNGTVVKEVCMPVSACYRFRLESTDDTSAMIYLDGNEFANASTENIVNIGDSC